MTAEQPGSGDRPPLWAVALLLAAATAAAALAAPGHLQGGVVDTADFEDYCAGTAWYSDEAGFWPRRRSRLAGLLAGLLAPFAGVVDGLLVASLACFLALSAALWAWARAIGGVGAAIVAVTAAAAMAPLATLARHLTWYPAIAAGLAIGSALLAIGLLPGPRPRLRWGLACAGVALMPLLDLRGIAWCFAGAAALGAAALAQPGRAGRLAALAGALALSWGAGPLAYAPDTLSLEQQAWQAIHLQSVARQQARGEPAMPEMATHTVWGRSPLAKLPAGLRTVAAIGAEPAARGDRFAADGRMMRLWSALFAAGAAGAAWRLRRDPWRLAALAASAAPWALAWIDGARGAAELRQLALAAPGVAAVIGAGLGSWLPATRRAWLLAASILLCGALALGTLGWGAPSRQHLVGPLLAAAERGEAPAARLRGACVRALRERGPRMYGLAESLEER